MDLGSGVEGLLGWKDQEMVVASVTERPKDLFSEAALAPSN